MMEMLENIADHAKKQMVENSDLKEGIFILGKENDDYLISTGNLVETSRVPALKEYIEKLNTMDYGELRKLYVKNLKKSKLPFFHLSNNNCHDREVQSYYVC